MIGSLILSAIPLPYRILAGAALTLTVLGGTAWVSYHKGEETGKLAIAQFQTKKDEVAAQVVDKDRVNNDAATIKYITQTRVIHDKQVEYVNVANSVVPSQNFLSKGWIYTHDQAALGLSTDKTLSADPSPSDTKDNVALATVTTNYTNCDMDREQLRLLQQSILDHNAAIKDVKVK